MNFRSMFRAAALVGLGLATAACQHEDLPASASTRAGAAILPGEGFAAYFGEIFSVEETALASKPPDSDVPGF